MAGGAGAGAAGGATRRVECKVNSWSRGEAKKFRCSEHPSSATTETAARIKKFRSSTSLQPITNVRRRHLRFDLGAACEHI